jgi:hypothetical protein
MTARRSLLGLVLGAGLALTTTGAVHGQVRPESPVVGARKQVTDADAAAKLAKAAMEQSKMKVIATFKTTNPDYAKAEEELAKSKQEVEAAKLAAQVSARKKPEYIAAASAKAAASEQNKAGGNPDAAGEIMKQVSVMNRLESQALETDTKYLEAKGRNAEAAKALEVFKTQLDQAFAVDPDYIATSQAYATAQQTVLTANESLKQVIKSEAAARAAESKARSEANKSRSK